MARSEGRANALRLLLALVVLGGAYLTLCSWSAGHLPADLAVGGVPVGGMSPEQAVAALDRSAVRQRETPIVVTVPGSGESFEVVPADAGLDFDAARSVEGLTGFSLDPRTIWRRLTESVEAPLLTRTDDDALTTYLTARAAQVRQPATEGAVAFTEGRITVTLPHPGRALDVPGTKLAVRRAFPDATQARAVVTAVAPTVGEEAVRAAAEGFAAKAMSGPVKVAAGTTTTSLTPAQLAPALSMVPDGRGGLAPRFDEARLTRLVLDTVPVPTRAARNATWSFVDDRPRLVPSVDGAAVDETTIARQVVAALTSPDRTARITPVATRPAFSTADADKAGVREVVADFASPFPADDPTRTNNLVVATRRINGTYVPPGGTFSLNGILGERTTDKGYADGTVIIDGRLTRGTGGGVSQVSTTIYNLAYFAGADIVEATPHAFFIPRYPEGREATVYWPTVDNKWKNDTAYGMLLQTWVEGGQVRGRVWSTKVWDVKSVKGERRNVKEPRTVRDDSPTCYPQQPNPGFDVTVVRQWYRPGSPALVRSESSSTHYIPEDRIICTNPAARR
ncbi:MAG TPA: VanW family protein [Intrasporangium sp.]|uniref:VanW family protein n=1 Tax=Intrasporangium sp. TaxID=1925024 RepID=UPI002D79D54D|nr:VanW family protein [Intrasporangium sp.]HET7397639.1 VanW family protein [Intrasporangium sp.]